MVETTVVITISVVVLLLLLVPITAWIVPKSLGAEEEPDEELPETRDDSTH